MPCSACLIYCGVVNCDTPLSPGCKDRIIHQGRNAEA